MNQQESVAGPTRWLAGLWEYYRAYTRTAIHAAATAALTAFGLLIFIDPLFAILAILAYLTPPIVPYSLGTDVEPEARSAESDQGRVTTRTNADRGSEPNGKDSDSDSDGDESDSDQDGWRQ